MVTLVAQFSISGSILSLNTPKQLWAVGLLVLGTQEEEAIYDILKISSPHSLIAELLGSADPPGPTQKSFCKNARLKSVPPNGAMLCNVSPK